MTPPKPRARQDDVPDGTARMSGVGPAEWSQWLGRRHPKRNDEPERVESLILDARNAFPAHTSAQLRNWITASAATPRYSLVPSADPDDDGLWFGSRMPQEQEAK